LKIKRGGHLHTCLADLYSLRMFTMILRMILRMFTMIITAIHPLRGPGFISQVRLRLSLQTTNMQNRYSHIYIDIHSHIDI
jgi:hypothetical protein